MKGDAKKYRVAVQALAGGARVAPVLVAQGRKGHKEGLGKYPGQGVKKMKGRLRNSVKKTWVRQQDMKAEVVDGDREKLWGTQCLGQVEVCGVRLRWSRVCRSSASKLSRVAAGPTVCAHRKSETLEAFQALEEGRVERLDGKTPVPPSKGHLTRRRSSPNLPREVRLGCTAGPHSNSAS